MKEFPITQAHPVPRHSVHEDEVEASIRTKAIGNRIRRLRLGRSMGLMELGAKTKLSASFLSQLETGRVIPTVKHLARIARVFDKDIAIFFQKDMEKDEPFRILRAGERIHLNLGGKGAAEMITQNLSALVPDRSIIPCIADIAPSEEDIGFLPTVFQGTEFVYVMEGTLEMTVGRETQIAQEQDAVWVEGRVERRYRSASALRAKVMIITFPDA